MGRSGRRRRLWERAGGGERLSGARNAHGIAADTDLGSRCPAGGPRRAARHGLGEWGAARAVGRAPRPPRHQLPAGGAIPSRRARDGPPGPQRERGRRRGGPLQHRGGRSRRPRPARSARQGPAAQGAAFRLPAGPSPARGGGEHAGQGSRPGRRVRRTQGRRESAGADDHRSLRRARLVPSAPRHGPGLRLSSAGLRRRAGPDLVGGHARRLPRPRGRADLRHRVPAACHGAGRERLPGRPARVQAHAARDGVDRGLRAGSPGPLLRRRPQERHRLRPDRPGGRRHDRHRAVRVAQRGQHRALGVLPAATEGRQARLRPRPRQLDRRGARRQPAGLGPAHAHGLRDRPEHRQDQMATRGQAVVVRLRREEAVRLAARCATRERRHDHPLQQRRERGPPERVLERARTAPRAKAARREAEGARGA